MISVEQIENIVFSVFIAIVLLIVLNYFANKKKVIIYEQHDNNILNDNIHTF